MQSRRSFIGKMSRLFTGDNRSIVQKREDAAFDMLERICRKCRIEPARLNELEIGSIEVNIWVQDPTQKIDREILRATIHRFVVYYSVAENDWNLASSVTGHSGHPTSS